ncbi:hypothetical protein [uncultured Martelella sp.]|uniref:hypothetical protein n=1 Tax=uncultured Martelella sp. TaxID=392331 RepID=UPI0029C9A5C5|nr:hypothetical protein [uncultured Martelella sp.]
MADTQEIQITNDMLILERGNPAAGGVQRLYRLPNGFGLSLINGPIAHPYPYAWEAAVVTNMDETGKYERISYDTELTRDVEVFETVQEANDFIGRAKKWALASKQ